MSITWRDKYPTRLIRHPEGVAFMKEVLRYCQDPKLKKYFELVTKLDPLPLTTVEYDLDSGAIESSFYLAEHSKLKRVILDWIRCEHKQVAFYMAGMVFPLPPCEATYRALYEYWLVKP